MSYGACRMVIVLPLARPCISFVVSPFPVTGAKFSVEHGLGDAVIGHPHKVCEVAHA